MRKESFARGLGKSSTQRNFYIIGNIDESSYRSCSGRHSARAAEMALDQGLRYHWGSGSQGPGHQLKQTIHPSKLLPSNFGNRRRFNSVHKQRPLKLIRDTQKCTSFFFIHKLSRTLRREFRIRRVAKQNCNTYMRGKQAG